MARDKFHYEVKQALVTDGWSITNDPLYIKIGTIPIQIDLGAEKIIGAEKDGEKIAVEIKTFSRLSFINAFHDAVGQYIVYREALSIIESDRDLYLAVPFDTYEEYGSEILVQRVFANNKIKVIIYEPITQHIISWIK
jgi:XisH protein